MRVYSGNLIPNWADRLKNLHLPIHVADKPTLNVIFSEKLYRNRFEKDCSRTKENAGSGWVHSNVLQILFGRRGWAKYQQGTSLIVSILSNCFSCLYITNAACMILVLTFSLSMASSLPGANIIRSWRLVTEAARLDKAEREEDGLIPTKALVTVERLSWRWLISATLRLSLLFSKSDMSMESRRGERRGGKTQDKKKERKDREKKCSWEQQHGAMRRKVEIQQRDTQIIK